MCQLCDNSESNESIYCLAGGKYDMPDLIIDFEYICKQCWRSLCLMESDLITISVQYHRNYHSYRGYEEFLKKNPQMDDNKFYKQNLIFRNGKAVRVGDRRKEIEDFIMLNKKIS